MKICANGVFRSARQKKEKVRICMIEKINRISSKEDFIKYIRSLVADYTNNKDEWENITIPDYLEQIASWIEDYSVTPQNDIEWEKIDYRILAQLLYMGKIYE